MKNYSGFSSFEFYFVISVIGIIVLVGLQRYLKLGDETQRLGFQIVAQNFNSAIYNFHAKWIVISQNPNAENVIDLGENKKIYSNDQGWPIGRTVDSNDRLSPSVSLLNCLELWTTFLHNPPSISFAGGEAYGTSEYYLTLTPDNSCRYEFITGNRERYYFDYQPEKGQVIFHIPTKD